MGLSPGNPQGALKRWKRRVRPVYWAWRHFWQNLPYRLRFYRALAKNGFHADTVLCYPDQPDFGRTAARVSWLLGYRTTNRPSVSAVLTFAFEVATYKTADETLRRLVLERQVINGACRDLSKSAVERAQQLVFGYGLAVDPVTHAGRCVRKSEINSVRDGLLIDCPAEPEEGFIYQRFIDATNTDGLHENIRVPVVGDSIPLVHLWYFDPAHPFDDPVKADVAETDAYLSAEEQRQLIAFSHEMGVDFGELDALRDNGTGRIYVIDITDTPSGPIDLLPRSTRVAAVGRVAESLKAQFVDAATRSPAEADSRL